MTSHTVRWDALIAGLIFAGIGATWLVDHYKWFEIDLALNMTYVLPIALIFAGLLGIVATLRKPHNKISQQPTLNGESDE